MAKNIYLIGMPLAGKTSVAKLLSKKLNIPYLDTDEKLAAYGLSKEAALNAPATFRAEETKLYLADYQAPIIMATGGGIINNPQNFVNFNGLIIYLYLDPASLYYRMSKYAHPVYAHYNYRTLFEKRDPLYRKYADIIIDVSSADLHQVVREISFKYYG